MELGINMPKKNYDEIIKLLQQEKYERLHNNIAKHLDICIKIVQYYLKTHEYSNLLDMIKSISSKANQSSLVTIEIIKYILKEIYPRIEKNLDILYNFLESSEQILTSIKLKEVIVTLIKENFNDFKKQLKTYISEKKYLEAKNIIIDLDYKLGSDNKIKSELSLELIVDTSCNKTHFFHPSSVRNFSLISPLVLSEENKSCKGLNYSKGEKILNSDVIENSDSQIFVKLAFDFTVTQSLIKNIFLKEAINSDFYILPGEIDTSVTAIRKDYNCRKLFLECLGIIEKKPDYYAIRFSIKLSENKYERVVELVTQCGNNTITQNLIRSCVKSFLSAFKKVRVISKHRDLNLDQINSNQINSMIISPSNSKPSSYKQNNSYEYLIDEEGGINDNKETSNSYIYYKILSQENYDLGKSVSIFVKEFIEKNRNREKVAEYIPNQMDEILKFVEECVSTFYCYFNYGKSKTENMLPFCRPSVEKFIFNKLYFCLFEIYKFKFANENMKFNNQQQCLSNKFSIKEIMDFLEIKDKFRAENRGNIIPYKSCIDCINKIQYEISPKEKLETLMKASLELRSCILDISKGTVELNSMDDELPLFIYILTQINIKYIFSELNIIEDYLRHSKSIDKESKVLTNMKVLNLIKKVSIHFISMQWDTKTKN